VFAPGTAVETRPGGTLVGDTFEFVGAVVGGIGVEPGAGLVFVAPGTVVLGGGTGVDSPEVSVLVAIGISVGGNAVGGICVGCVVGGTFVGGTVQTAVGAACCG
jgi:hypothetical protein